MQTLYNIKDGATEILKYTIACISFSRVKALIWNMA